MNEETLRLVVAAAVLAAAVIGFFLGRSRVGGANKRVEALEAEVLRQKEEVSGYKHEVEAHFEKTASLVASMAGTYKDLFEHLSSGSEQLANGNARQLLRDRVSGLLLNSADQAATTDKVSAALAEAGAPLADKVDAAESQPSAAASEGDTRKVAVDPDAASTSSTANDDAATPDADKLNSDGSSGQSTPGGEETPSPAGQKPAAGNTTPPA